MLNITPHVPPVMIAEGQDSRSPILSHLKGAVDLFLRQQPQPSPHV